MIELYLPICFYEEGVIVYSYYKVFRKSNGSNVFFELFEYDKTVVNSYLNLIEDRNKQEFRQVILNSFLMIAIIRFMVKTMELKVESITFIDDDECEYHDDIKNILKNQKENYLDDLIKELSVFKSEDSVEINEICFEKDNSDIDLKIKVNGIVIINNENAEEIKGAFENFLTGQFK